MEKAETIKLLYQIKLVLKTVLKVIGSAFLVLFVVYAFSDMPGMQQVAIVLGAINLGLFISLYSVEKQIKELSVQNKILISK